MFSDQYILNLVFRPPPSVQALEGAPVLEQLCSAINHPLRTFPFPVSIETCDLE